MGEIPPGSASDALRSLHTKLDKHFRALHTARRALVPVAPVFALEHDLPPAEMDLLLSAVRSGVREGLSARHRLYWLPLVVYAAESGYDYVGDEYWPPFERATPGWRHDHRSLVKTWFQKFAAEYGGAVPTGAFAASFRIIAWPITHAVLPTYLQRHLAQLLFEFSGALTSDLLDDPSALGERLARRASGYTERFRIFCQNTELLGQVAAALLADTPDESPYLTSSTLERLVDGISREQRGRHWLTSARRSAKRARTSGFLGPAKGGAKTGAETLSRATAPKLFLRFDGVWNAHAELPDLTAIESTLPHVYERLRTHRVRVSGAKKAVPRSGLLYGGHEVQFIAWPSPDEPFLQLDGSDERIDRILADQCLFTPGPWWLFRRERRGLALEVKGKVVRPGRSYVLIGGDGMSAPDAAWVQPTAISVAGVSAFELAVPDHVTEAEEAALLAAGISVQSSVAIRPVGIVASAWDGEGEAEWLAGEPALVGVRSDLMPALCRMVAGQQTCFLAWPSGQSELLVALDGLPVGTQELRVALLGEGDRQIAEGSLNITIRDPQVRPAAATTGEGIRLMAAPARPTLAELWDERATVSIDGPAGADAELAVELRDNTDTPLVRLWRSVQLPVDEAAWTAVAKSLRSDADFEHVYNDSESCVIAVSRGGVGFASLTVERGFQPLRWRFSREHDGHARAALVDRTDGSETTVEYYPVESPLVAESKAPGETFVVPPRGGLAIARTGDATASVILPTDPNRVFHMLAVQPLVEVTTRSREEVLRLVRAHRRWMLAERPADAFAAHQALEVQKAIARAIATLVGGNRWAQLERTLLTASDPADYLEEMRSAVGVSDEHRALAEKLAYRLHEWLKSEPLFSGFAEVIEPALRRSGMKGPSPAAARFLLTLAGWPGYISDWPEEEAVFLLGRILDTPVLFRAARFVVLGTAAINDGDGVGVERGLR